MELTDEQLQELKSLYGNVLVAEEGGTKYILIEKAQMPLGCTPNRSDLLFCPSTKDGYESRLYFETKVEGPGVRNWNGSVFILNRTWYAFSWRFSHPGDLRLAQAIQSHLRGFRA